LQPVCLIHHEKHTHILKNKVQKMVACTQNLEEEIKIRKKQHAIIDEATIAASLDQTANSDFLKFLLRTRNSREEHWEIISILISRFYAEGHHQNVI